MLRYLSGAINDGFISQKDPFQRVFSHNTLLRQWIGN